MDKDEPGFLWRHETFGKVLGTDPKIRQCMPRETVPWAHEAGVFIPGTGDIFVTSNRIISPDGEQKVVISKFSLENGLSSASREEITPTTTTNNDNDDDADDAIVMANGGVNYQDGILFCSQGNKHHPSGLFHMEAHPPYRTKLVLGSFSNGRPFNSPNDIVVHPGDGAIWFTDPIYGYEQGFRPRPRLPNQVYRFDPRSGSVRAVADGFGRPNGISFSPDLGTLYVTDTDLIHGDGTVDEMRPASM